MMEDVVLNVMMTLLATCAVYSIVFQMLCVFVPLDMFEKISTEGTTFVANNPFRLAFLVVSLFYVSGLSIAGILHYTHGFDVSDNLCVFMMAYLVFVTIGDLIGKFGNPASYIHHLVVFVLAIICLSIPAFMKYVPFMFGIVEISSIFFTLHLAIKGGNVFNKTIHTLVRVVFVFTFFVTRIVMMPLVFKSAVWEMEAMFSTSDDVWTKIGIVSLFLFGLMIQTLQFYWFNQMRIKFMKLKSD